MTLSRLTLLFGAFSAALIAGALTFQYLGGLAPCEMCEWQRWPHIAAAVVGLGGGALLVSGTLGERFASPLLVLTAFLIAISGAIAVYHAGVEWQFWSGPAACTGARVEFTGIENINDPGTVRCDLVQWRLFGLSLAGYNALLSFAAAAFGIYAGTRRRT